MTAMVRAGSLQGYLALMQSLGCKPAGLLSRHRIASATLADEDALISLRSGMRLMEASAIETGCPDFGLRLSKLQDISVLGPLAIVLQNATTVRKAWDYVARHIFVQTPGLVVTVHDRSSLIAGAVEISLDLRLPRLPEQRQTIDLCLGDLHHITQLMAGRSYELHAVSLPHTPVAPLAVYKRFFNAAVHCDQPRAALHLSPETLATDLRGANPALRQIAEDYFERHFRSPDQSVSARVRLALRRTLGSKADVAQLLAIHPRTLQRHLAAEGANFETLREETRQEAALHYLRQTEIPLGRVADLLGFSEQSVLARSCRRWFGTTPTAIRRQGEDAGVLRSVGGGTGAPFTPQR
ncbi:AraC family transcriptional regulator [Variovorax saccharolyticus]|uniref:AraC family transcriptional regulator n=1 Tax=Variovorax saccharolyticus TaxID=3053516 RepID=UPI0025762219|nr:AraC family transcriptional regulator [Variovorax sp. J31P216]MDM0024395.1 AraC family transcriptional regulator ligand-binding domain-containing protein [Variovorax sp. J31P216]